MKIKFSERELLYWREFERIQKKPIGLRDFVIISAIMEAQIYSLALSIARIKKSKFEPKKNNQFDYCRRIVEKATGKISQLKEFRKAREFVFHDSFKNGTSIERLESTIAFGNEIGKELVKKLHTEMTQFEQPPGPTAPQS